MKFTVNIETTTREDMRLAILQELNALGFGLKFDESAPVETVAEPVAELAKRKRRTKAEMQADAAAAGAEAAMQEAHSPASVTSVETGETRELDYQNDVRPLLTQLHTKLGGPAQFTAWTRENVTSLGLIEGIDWKTLKPADYAQAIALLKGALA